jgi:hypothetical protein
VEKTRQLNLSLLEDWAEQDHISEAGKSSKMKKKTKRFN